MTTDIRHFAAPVPPEAFDEMMTSGWRPTGQSMYTSDYLRTEDSEIYGCIQLRLPLHDHTFRKSQRKLINKNAKKFHYKIGIAGRPTQDFYEVNAKYMKVFPNRSKEDIEFHVFGYHNKKILNTHQVQVFDGDRLVAFSYFDLGKSTVYTKAGIYDPKYKADSLGVYTILLEIMYAKSLGVKYYHPGYYSPSYSCFDYKLAIGKMEYLNTMGAFEWLPIPDNVDDYPQDPKEVCLTALEKVREVFSKSHDVQTYILEYPSFSARISFPDENLLDGPAILLIRDSTYGAHAIQYDIQTDTYRYIQIKPSQYMDTATSIVGKSGLPRLIHPVVVIERAEIVSRMAEDIVEHSLYLINHTEIEL